MGTNAETTTETIRNAAGSYGPSSAAVDEATLQAIGILELLRKKLSDEQDHPEIWAAWPEFLANFPKLATLTTHGIANTFAGDPMEIPLRIAHALTLAHQDDAPAGIALLERLCARSLPSPAVLGASAFLQKLAGPESSIHQPATTRAKIPKTIHIIWIGDESKRPDRMIDTWRQMNPGYTVRVWGNDDLRTTQWWTGDQIRSWLPRAIVGAVDIMRWEILYRYGGIAVDADSACVRPLEDWLLEPECFAVWENEIARPGLIATGAMGCTPNHPLIGRILLDIVNDPELTSKLAWEKTGPRRLTDTVQAMKFSDITVYPSHYFIPRHFSGLHYTGSGTVFATQEWGSTRGTYGQLR